MEPVEVFQRPPLKSRDIAVSKMAEILTFDCAGPMPPRVFQIRMSSEQVAALQCRPISIRQGGAHDGIL